VNARERDARRIRHSQGRSARTKPILAVSCLMLCAACVGEPSDTGATGRAVAADVFSLWPGMTKH